jgi:transposase
MAKALSVDLRQRVIAAIDGALSCRQAAERFGVSAASAIRHRADELSRRLFPASASSPQRPHGNR